MNVARKEYMNALKVHHDTKAHLNQSIENNLFPTLTERNKSELNRSLNPGRIRTGTSLQYRNRANENNRYFDFIERSNDKTFSEV